MRSLVPACDVDLGRFERIVAETADLPRVGAYKIGARLALSAGVGAAVRAARRHTDKPLIYDHQKAGTDIADTSDWFMATLAHAGVDAVILFPLAGPESQIAWTRAAVEHDLVVLVGAHMSGARFLEEDGGYIPRLSVDRIYRLAAECGVTDFVVPGNDLSAITRVSSLVDTGGEDRVFYVPGLLTQGGRMADVARAAGNRWHAIVGRAVTQHADVRAALEALSISLC